MTRASGPKTRASGPGTRASWPGNWDSGNWASTYGISYVFPIAFANVFPLHLPWFEYSSGKWAWCVRGMVGALGPLYFMIVSMLLFFGIIPSRKIVCEYQSYTGVYIYVYTCMREYIYIYIKVCIVIYTSILLGTKAYIKKYGDHVWMAIGLHRRS